MRPDDLAAVGALLDGAREEIAVARRGELMLRDGSGPPGDRELAELASDARGRVLVAWLAGVAVGVGA
ncbi:MAG: hypothetical protein M0Z33_01715, partial [Actinomycetota bacterium]|nr:hypothetical protein [Actinomycetota bacterium]